MRTSRRSSLLIALTAALLAQGQTFTARDPLPAVGRGEPVIFSIDGKVYLGSGGYENDFFVYDPADDSWTPLGTIPGVTTARSFSTSFVINNKAYVCLGLDNTIYKNDLWEYDPTTNTWDQKQDLPAAGRAGAFGFAVNGKGYVGGGFDTGFLYGDFYSYDPVNDQWALIGPNPLGPGYFSSACSFNGQGYLIGGALPDGTDALTVYRYDPISNVWTPRTSFIGPPRDAAACFVLADKVYYGTGATAQFSIAYNDFYAYDPASDSWGSASIATFPSIPRGWTGACSTGSRAFLGLGWNLGATLFSDWWEFQAPVGVQETAGGNTDVILFPVPAMDAITVRTQDQHAAVVNLIDAEGRTVRTALSQGEVRLDLSGLAGGTYDVMVTMGQASPMHRRFVKL